MYNWLQKLLRSAWGHVASTMGQTQGDRPSALDEGGITSEAAVNAGAPPTLGDPVSGPVQLAQTLWRSFGPGILANGVGFLQQTQNPIASNPSATSAAHTRSVVAQSDSVLDRRRQLEAELAALPQVKGYDVTGSSPSPPILIPKANNNSRRNSSSSSLRSRGGNNRSAFEEVEVPSDMEGDGYPVQPTQRSSWFWGSGSSKGYERVKAD